jgi:5-hydroxyisourate hydrolase
MSAITTHVLDTSRGCPAAGVAVVLERRADDNRWDVVGRGHTDADGRQRDLMPETGALTPGIYRLVFDTDRYFYDHGVAAFYPQVIVEFRTTPGDAHYHVPLLLGPFGYTTYRGT